MCEPGALSCRAGDELWRCNADGTGFELQEECARRDQPLLCTPLGCRECPPAPAGGASRFCARDGLAVHACDEDGRDRGPVQQCSAEDGTVCESAGNEAECVSACELAARQHSYVGCEYWPVDLDNAAVTGERNAAEQQFAVVVSNPSALVAKLEVEIADGAPGAELTIGPAEVRDQAGDLLEQPIRLEPGELRALLLPPREVDGSPPGEFNTGTGSAHTAQAYRVRSSAPIIAYQFNPFADVGVFSNDASLLIPTEALGAPSGTLVPAYHVLGWPQTVAHTDDPATNLDYDGRAYVTIVGTAAETAVEVQLSADILPLPGVAGALAGETLRVTLAPFEVLNLETDGFNADLSGTQVWTDKPVAVYSGTEVSDVPFFEDLRRRRCCADHLEEQLFPLTSLGKQFVVVHSPSRTCALEAAGSDLICRERETECFRFLAAGGEFPSVRTTLPSPNDRPPLEVGRPFSLCDVTEDFVVESDEPLIVGQFVTSQIEAVGVGNLQQPAGDPAFILWPPVEQFRREYLFLVPEHYAFDFLMIAAPDGADVRLDGESVDQFPGCGRRPVGTLTIDNRETEFSAITCALSEPAIERRGGAVTVDEGLQNDGVHTLTSDDPVGLVVYGFDRFVSYGYPGGTDLRPINLR